MTTYDPEDFKIVLNPPPGEGESEPVVYVPGSEVSGALFVRVTSPQQFDDIVINLQGKGYVRWTKTTLHMTLLNGPENPAYPTKAMRKADKLYVDLTKTLWSKSEAPEGSLPPGEHSFPFCFKLPQRVPSSHESSVEIPCQFGGDYGNGWTRYSLNARMNRAHPRSDHVHTEKRLTVKEVIDINMPQLQLPVNMRVRKTAGCFFSCISGTVIVTLTLPKTGFCVDEDISYHITIDNGGSRLVEATTTLEEHIVYHTRFRKCFPKVILHGRVNNGPVQPGQTATLTPEVQVLKIPTSVIAIMNSSIIKQSFILKVKVHVPSVIFNPILICPLVISNMPYRQEEVALPPVEVNQVIPSSAPPPSYVPTPSQNFIQSGIPIQQIGGPPANSGASVLASTEPPSYEDSIKKY